MSATPFRFALIGAALLLAVSSAAGAERSFPAGTMKGALASSRDAAVVGKLAALRRAAVSDGTVRIIVGLRVPFAAEGELGAERAAAQRAEIAAATAALRQSMSSRRAFTADRMRLFEAIPFAAMRLTADELDTLARLPGVISIEPDALLSPALAQSGPVITAPSAWAAGYTGKGQVVAVLDSGIDKNHPFLAGKVVEEGCYSGGGSPADSFCPGGVTASTEDGSGMPCPLTYGSGKCEHGTHVGGIIAGTGRGFSGTAKDAKLMSFQVVSKVNGTIQAYTSDLVAALNRVYALRYNYRIAAVNMSLAGEPRTSYCDSSWAAMKAAIDNLRASGIATVIAAGNDSRSDAVAEPACISSAFSVGATWDAALASNPNCPGATQVDQVACFSNSARFLNFLAPGALINSSIPGGGYKSLAGTSMATPHVAGAWAVIKQKVPFAGVPAVAGALAVTGEWVTDSRNATIKPRINVLAALNKLPAVHLQSASYSVRESAMAITIRVQRTTATGVASVDYSTLHGSALPGQDYTGKSGKLSFAAGVSVLTISIPIINDARREGKELFSVRLDNPVGIDLTTPYAANVTIDDDDTPSP